MAEPTYDRHHFTCGDDTCPGEHAHPTPASPPGQSQQSTTDQLRAVQHLANRHGYYDAADVIQRHLDGATAHPPTRTGQDGDETARLRALVRHMHERIRRGGPSNYDQFLPDELTDVHQRALDQP